MFAVEHPLVVFVDFLDEAQDTENLATFVDPSADGGRIYTPILVLSDEALVDVAELDEPLVLGEYKFDPGGDLAQRSAVALLGLGLHEDGLLDTDPLVFALGDLLEAATPLHDIHEIVDTALLDPKLLHEAFRFHNVFVLQAASPDERFTQLGHAEFVGAVLLIDRFNRFWIVLEGSFEAGERGRLNFQWAFRLIWSPLLGLFALTLPLLHTFAHFY